MPLFDLTLIPFIWTETQDSSIVDLIAAMAADPQNHDLLEDTRTLLPVGGLEATASRTRAQHEQTTPSHSSTRPRQFGPMEGGAGHYMGMMSSPVTGAAGVAPVPDWSSLAAPSGSIIAHELGHNMNLRHAPCGGAFNHDPSFPYPDGSIGSWGYDFRDGGRTGPAFHGGSDVLLPTAMDQRLQLHERASLSPVRRRGTGNCGRGGRSDQVAPSLGRRRRGRRTLPGARVRGRRPGRPSRFCGRIPSSRTHRRLAANSSRSASPRPRRRTATGLPHSSSYSRCSPGGRAGSPASRSPDPAVPVTLDGKSDRPMAILRNPRNGQVRGILRDVPHPAPAAWDAVRASDRARIGHARSPYLAGTVRDAPARGWTWRRRHRARVTGRESA